MNRLKHWRKRVSEFASRKSHDPSNVFTVPQKGWEYIPVHPMSDEVPWLEAHRMVPSDCTKVDCYWRLTDDVAFLQLRTKYHDKEQQGLYARRGRRKMLYLDAIVNDESISRAKVEQVMEDFGKIHLSRNLFSDRRIGVRSRSIGMTSPR